MYARVYSVEHAIITGRTKKLPPDVLISIDGFAATSGWSDPQLSIRHYLLPPSDGILEVDFIAKRPESGTITLPVLSPIKLKTVIPSVPSWCTGIRVNASINSVIAEEGKGNSSVRAQALDDPGDVFPWILDPGTPSERRSGKLDMPIEDLIGRRARVYRDGDMITMDHVPERVNIVLQRYGHNIQDVWFG